MSEAPEKPDSDEAEIPHPRPSNSNSFKVAMLIVAGIFATTMAQPGVMGKLSLQNFLKGHLHVQETEMSAFFFMAGVAWYFKPFAGVLIDAFPLFRTRRRYYLLISAALAAASWIAMIYVPKTYNGLLYGAIMVNVFMVVASTVIGAFLVESGQRTGATGRLTALRQTVSSVCSLINGPIAGFLASGAFAVAAGANAVVVFSIFPVAYFLMKEKPLAERNVHAIANARTQLRTIGKSRNLWFAVGFIALFYFSPGFSTPLYFKQTNELKFSQPFIGLLDSFSGAFGILGAFVYSRLIKKVSVRAMITWGILLFGGGHLLYLLYNGATMAQIVESQNGFFFVMVEVALMDLAARATPAGCEGLGYSLILSARNLALFGADLLGSWLVDKKHWEFSNLVYLNVATTLVVLLFLPLMPKALMEGRDGVPS